MKLVSRNKFYSLWFIAICVLFVSCEDEVKIEDDQQLSFQKKYSGEKAEYTLATAEMDNGNIIMTGGYFDDPNKMRIMITDPFGHLLSENVVSTRYEAYPNLVKRKDGSFIAYSIISSDILIISNTGEILAQNEFEYDKYPVFMYTKPVYGDGGFYHFSYTNGGGTGAPSSNYVTAINESGEIEYSWRFPDALFGGKVLMLRAWWVQNEVYWMTGTMGTEVPFSFSDKHKMFFAKMDVNGNQPIKVITLDEDDDFDFDFMTASVTTQNGDLVNVVSRNQWMYNVGNIANHFDLIKVDTALQIKWRKTVKMPDKSNVEVVGIIETSAGDFMISGFCFKSGKAVSLPFLIRTNTEGEVIFVKYYENLGGSQFLFGNETRDNHFIVPGWTSGYGLGKEFTDAVLLKLDSEGNYFN